jgi:hypothetical protein
LKIHIRHIRQYGLELWTLDSSSLLVVFDSD